MKKLTKKDARFVLNQIFRSEHGTFHLSENRHRFGPTTKMIYFSPSAEFLMAYPLAYATTWEEAFDIARTKYTVKVGT